MKDKTEEMSELVELLKEYRERQSSSWGCEGEYRCSTCVKTDKLLSSLPPSGAASEATLKTVITSENRQILWIVFNNDGHECSDYVGAFGTEEEAKTVSERIEKGIRTYYAKNLPRCEWMGSVTIQQTYLNEYRLPCDAQEAEALHED